MTKQDFLWVEQRAAEIATPRGPETWGEVDGWVMAGGKRTAGAKRVEGRTPSKRTEWAGWLAFIIWSTR